MTYLHTTAHRLVLAAVFSLTLLFLALGSLARIQAWSEETGLYFYDPHDPVPAPYTDTVSSVHFDLVGALAIAAGFSEEDAAIIQIYSELTDPGVLPEATAAYSFTATTFPTAPPISEVVTSTICPSPSTTADIVSMGGTDLIECPGCFTSRFGPYGVFFHEPHDTPEELGAIEAWAFGTTSALTGVATFGYSGTVPSPLIPPDSPLYTATLVANVYESTPCFVTQTVQVDTGDVLAGSLEALGVYLHSLGDSWSHRACIAAADAEGKPFGAHVAVSGPDDPLWACRWTSHMEDFGGEYATDTYSGTLALYDALVRYATESGRALYHSIPITAENNYIQNVLYRFAYDTQGTVAGSHKRRAMAEELRRWALRTRTLQREYWLEPPLEVCASGCAYTTINAALAAAQAGDTVFVHPGVYTETIVLTPTVNLIGTPLLTVLEGNGAGPVVQAVNGNITRDTVFGGFVVQGGMAQQGAGIYVANGASPSLVGLVVKNNSDGGAANSAGAGLFVADTTSAPRLEWSTFLNNTADNGAAVYIEEAPVSIRYNAFELNRADSLGGAMMLVNSPTTVYSNTFVLNTAGSGGAIYIQGGNPTLETNLVAGLNTATNAGGGIAIAGGTAMVLHNRVISNTAGLQGGGLLLTDGANPTLHNNLIVANRSAVGLGGGVSIEGSTGVVRNNTIAQNQGDGVYLLGAGAIPALTNNIIAGNTYGVRAQDIPGSKPAPTLQNNDVWNNPSGDLVGENVASQAGQNLNEDPLFVAGPLGPFYLSHPEAGQDAISGLFDAGASTAGDLGLDTRTMRTDSAVDAGTVDIGYHYPIAPPLATRIYSATGGTVTFTAGITILLEFPAGAVTDTLTLALDTTAGHPISSTQRQVGSAFSVTAYDDSGAPVTGFAEPFTITIEYQGNDVKYLDESSLGLYYWDEGGTGGVWQAISTTVDTASNSLSATLDHLTEFIVLAESEALAESHFDQNREGWLISGDAQRGTGTPNYLPVGGYPGGHLQAVDDVQGGTWYWVAPEKFLGDMSAAYSTTLRFDLRQESGMANQYPYPDVVLTGYVDDQLVELSYNTPFPPAETWTSYAVLLHEEAGWRWLHGRNSTDPVTQEEMLSVLSSLVKLQIRGEFEDGGDTGYLDNVVLGEPASEMVVEPDAEMRSTLQTDPPGLIEFPDGAVGDSITLTVDITAGHPVTSGLGVLGRPFVIEARDGAGTPVTQFQRAFTLTFRYDDADAYGLDEQSLQLYYWDEGGAGGQMVATSEGSSGVWRAVPTTVDPASNTLSATLDHLTEFTIIGEVSCPNLNGDEQVDVVDIMLVASHWADPYDVQYDANGDGVIDVDDIMEVATRWRATCQPKTP